MFKDILFEDEEPKTIKLAPKRTKIAGPSNNQTKSINLKTQAKTNTPIVNSPEDSICQNCQIDLSIEEKQKEYQDIIDTFHRSNERIRLLVEEVNKKLTSRLAELDKRISKLIEMKF